VFPGTDLANQEGVAVRKLFVSYARENKSAVDELVEHLATLGYDTWVDVELRGGQDWWDEILERITDTDVFIAIYSSAVLNSTACAREYEWANALGKPVVPVAVEPPAPGLPSRFARRQIIDYSEPQQRLSAALKLGGAIATIPPAPTLPNPLPTPPEAPLSYLTDIVDAITRSEPMDHETQRQVLRRLEPALVSSDPQERESGRAIMERFSKRDDLYADVDRRITQLRNVGPPPSNDHSPPPNPAPSHQAPQPNPAPSHQAPQPNPAPSHQAHQPTGPQTPPQTYLRGYSQSYPYKPPQTSEGNAHTWRPPNKGKSRSRAIADVLVIIGLVILVVAFIQGIPGLLIIGGLPVVVAIVFYIVGAKKQN
jgi:hypothetical protein